jgi:hypothetical protein
LHLHLLFFHVLVKNSWQIGLYKICVSIGRRSPQVVEFLFMSKLKGNVVIIVVLWDFTMNLLIWGKWVWSFNNFTYPHKEKFFLPSMLHNCSVSIRSRTKTNWSSSVLTFLINIVVAILIAALACAWNAHFLRFYNFCVSSIVSLPYNGLMNFPHFV